MTTQSKLKQAFALLKEVVHETGVNLIDNYSYRELTVNEILRREFPSLKKDPGRTGNDACAINEGYYRIEEKSGTSPKAKTLTMASFPKLEFDKQNDVARREYIYTYDGLAVSFFEYYVPYPTAVVFVTKEQVPKLHPLLKAKQDAKLALFERKAANGENIGRDSITISLAEVVDAVGAKNLLCWLHGEKVDGEEFFRRLINEEIKINQ